MAAPRRQTIRGPPKSLLTSAESTDDEETESEEPQSYQLAGIPYVTPWLW